MTPLLVSSRRAGRVPLRLFHLRLDPNNVNALTFVSEGHIAGPMTPLTQEIPDSVVPLPASLSLLGSGPGAAVPWGDLKSAVRFSTRARGGKRS